MIVDDVELDIKYKYVLVNETPKLSALHSKLHRDDMSPAQRAEIAPHPVTLLCCLGQVEVSGVFQVRTLVEVTIERAA